MAADPDIARRNRSNRERGKRWERDLTNGLRELGYDIERTRDTGEKDEGDHIIRLRNGMIVVVQAKDEQTLTFSSYVDDAKKQRDHYLARRPGVDPKRVVGLAFVKRRGQAVPRAYVAGDIESVLPALEGVPL